MAPDAEQFISYSIVINASADTLYDMVADVTRMGEWSNTCTGATWDEGSGPIPIEGAWFTGHNVVGDREHHAHCEVVAARRPTTIAWMQGGRGRGVTEWRYWFTPVDGGTEVTESWTQVRPFPPDLVDQTMEKQMRRAFDHGIQETLSNLKASAELRTIDIVVKQTDPLRMAETIGIAAGFGHDHIGPIFEERLPVVWTRLVDAGVEPGTCVAYYEWPDDDGCVVVHLGFEVGDQVLSDDDDVRVVELPAVEVASALHRGPLHDISDTYEAVIRWIDGNGYRIADCSRELTLAWDPQDPATNIIEMQFPISR